jgi:hypothetical protein
MPFNTAPNAPEAIREITEEIGRAFRAAGHSYLDASAGILESIVDSQEQLKDEVDQKWLADVIGAQADFTRQLLNVNAAQRERLG